jgi:hypothetical protein
MVRALLDAHRRSLNILAFARKLGVIGVIVHHVSRAPAAGGVDVLLDGGRDEVLRGWG